jgi:O-antigen ligase
VQLALSERTRHRLLAWLQVGVIAAVLPMTLSRTGVIAAVIGLLAIAWHWSIRRKLLAGGVLVGGVAAFRLILPTMIDGLLTIFVTVGQDESTTGWTGRYEVAARYFLEHPWVGRGLSTLHPATGQIFDNQYLYAATETGVVGVVALLVLFVTIWSMTRDVRRRTRDAEVRSIAQALTGITIAMAVVFATADMASFAMVMTVFFLLAGVTGALWRLTPKPAGGASGPGAAGRSGRSPAPGPARGDRRRDPMPAS